MVNLRDLPDDVQERLQVPDLQNRKNTRVVSPRLPVLGRVLQDIGGMTTRDALWVLRTAIQFIISRRDIRLKSKTLRR